MALLTGILLSGGNAADQAMDRAFGHSAYVTPLEAPNAVPEAPAGLDEAHQAFYRTHAVVGMGGYGQTEAFDALSAAAPTLLDFGALYNLHYNPKGLDSGEVADEIARALLTDEVRERKEKVYVTLLGLSTGGKFAVRVAAALTERHGEEIVPALIIAVSSPYEWGSTRGLDKQTLARASGVMQRLRLYVGPVGRTVGQVVYELRTDDGIPAFDITGAWRRATPKPYDLQLSQLREVASPFPVEGLRALVKDQGLSVVYVRAIDPTRDTTVDVGRASESWRAAAGRDESFVVAKGPVGHAQFYLRPPMVQDMLAEALPMTGLPRVEVYTARTVTPVGRRLGGPLYPEPERRLPPPNRNTPSGQMP